MAARGVTFTPVPAGTGSGAGASTSNSSRAVTTAPTTTTSAQLSAVRNNAQVTISTAQAIRVAAVLEKSVERLQLMGLLSSGRAFKSEQEKLKSFFFPSIFLISLSRHLMLSRTRI